MKSRRDNFENWACKAYRADSVGHKSKVLDRLSNGEYRSPSVENDWRVWQAATEQGEPVAEIAISNNGNTAQLFYSSAAIKSLGVADGSYVKVYANPQPRAEQGVGEPATDDWRFYPCWSEPEVGDIVIRKNGDNTELTVSQVRLDKDCNVRGCSFNGKLCLDTPQDYELIRRAHPPKPTGGGVPEGEWQLMPAKLSYEERAKALLHFNTTVQNGGDHDDGLQAAYAALLATQQPPGQE